ncbi:hypothetical protein Q5H91_07340 [Sphingomonas sp. KR1UV-12]|uniref:Response regulatory domain-containing protein n=1 Tax=Sphingomonas aurea TaxID=3063994 RepID=A0ABT9EJK2_9SPHN|nr:hypothetical protein [Sphingomonas sp. KR1UV-12]MDP1027020.1 hypothetical protein [Sphingomonas sp. KR1UV-12]
MIVTDQEARVKKGALSLLHVERDADRRLITSVALQLDNEIQVISCPNITVAAIKMQAFRLQFDAVIIDSVPTTSTEVSALDRFRYHARATALPLIFLTSRLMRHEVAAMRELGSVGIIGKPFDPLTLSMQVRELLSA